MVGVLTGELTVHLLGIVDDLLLSTAGPLDELGAVLASKFGVLGHPVRRKTLSILADEPHTSRSELAERVLEADQVSHEDVDTLAVALHHKHLPKLDDEGYVEYDARTGDVVLWTDVKTVKTLLESEMS